MQTMWDVWPNARGGIPDPRLALVPAQIVVGLPGPPVNPGIRKGPATKRDGVVFFAGSTIMSVCVVPSLARAVMGRFPIYLTLFGYPAARDPIERSRCRTVLPGAPSRFARGPWTQTNQH